MKKQFLITCIVAGLASGHLQSFYNDALDFLQSAPRAVLQGTERLYCAAADVASEINSALLLRPWLPSVLMGEGIALSAVSFSILYLEEARKFSIQKNTVKNRLIAIRNRYLVLKDLVNNFDYGIQPFEHNFQIHALRVHPYVISLDHTRTHIRLRDRTLHTINDFNTIEILRQDVPGGPVSEPMTLDEVSAEFDVKEKRAYMHAHVAFAAYLVGLYVILAFKRA